MSEGNRKVDMIMAPLQKHIKERAANYNRIYEAVWDLVNKLDKAPFSKKVGNTVGEQEDIIINLNIPSTPESIDYIHFLEKAFDDMLGHIGYSRSKSSKGDICKLVYYRFAFTQ